MASNAPHLYIALYTDADVHGDLAKEIRARGHDAVSAFEVGNADIDDELHLEFAIRQGRALFTHNTKHFALLASKYGSAGREHYGIIVSEQLPVGELLRRVLRMLDSVSAAEMKNNFRNLGEFK